MIRKILPEETHHFNNDPVRPHLPAYFRTTEPNETYVFSFEDKIDAVICVAYVDNIPQDEQQLIEGCCNEHNKVATFYTVWSYTKGAGTEIIFAVKEHIQNTKPYVDRYVTLSPCTDMATNFHLKNGAVLLNKFDEYQNFEYK